jgi:hypothetical protein
VDLAVPPSITGGPSGVGVFFPVRPIPQHSIREMMVNCGPASRFIRFCSFSRLAMTDRKGDYSYLFVFRSDGPLWGS